MLTRAHEIGDEECLSGDPLDARECGTCERCGKVYPEREDCAGCPCYYDIRRPHDPGEAAQPGCMGCEMLEPCPDCDPDNPGYESAADAAEREGDEACHAAQDEEDEDE